MDVKEVVSGCGLDSCGSGWGPVVGYCKHMKGREFD